MSDYLISHAVKNAWCSPRQDLQVTYCPQRISSPRGVRGVISLMWGSVTMPTSTDVYHVYQIGQYQATLVGLSPVRNVWRSLASLMNEEFLMADLYTEDGVHLSRFNSFVLVTAEQNVLVAVREQKRIADLRTQPVYLRLYSNAFFNSARSDGYAHEILCRGGRVMTSAEALNIQRDFHLLRARTVGHAWLFVNGLYRDDYTPADFVMGDYLEYVYDSSVKAVKEFTIGELETFDSERDLKRKYLLHYPGEQVGGPMIDYRDDIDVYVFKKETSGRYTGLYYHKNNDDALRQVTHRDYSIVVDYVARYQEVMAPKGWTDVDKLKVRLFIRHAGYARPLVHEHHRIQELYKLPESDRMRAMVGIDANVPWWHAAKLENSAYVKLMGVRSNKINVELVRDAYGYNALAKLLGETPLPVQNFSGRRAVKLPYGLQVDSTAFELDSAGKLINTYIHTKGVEYTPFNSTCSMVEMIVGRGGPKLDMTFNVQDQPIDPRYSYRFYVAPVEFGELRNDKWRDVTGDDSVYQIINGKVRWFIDTTYNATCVKSDANFTNYELTLKPNNGVLKFSVNATVKWAGTTHSGVLHIPPGRLDLWLNDECLIEGLDFIVRWPEIVITNKKFLNDGGSQKIRVRGTGFCNADMTRREPKEVGFVRWGKLSRNNRFDLRDDRVVRLVVNGRTYHRDAIRFTEGDPSLWMDGVPNGSPYLLDDLVVPLRRAVPNDTYELRAKSKEVDQAVSDYLTLKLPEHQPTTPDPIPERYAIYSPFTAAIMYDLLSERLSVDKFKGHYSDQDVRTYLADYEHLLEYEPTRRELDLDYVIVHPHDRTTVIELNAYQYFLLNRAIKVFLQDKVDITRFVRIKDSYI